MMNKKIDKILQDSVKAGKVPGVVALVANDKSIIYEGAFGKRELGKDALMTPDSVGYIASMTKAITAVCAMQLVEQGKLKLDSPAVEVIPELKAKVLVGFDNTGKPILREPKRPITLRHLLTHTSGFGYEIWSKDVQRYQKATGTPSIFTSKNATLTIPLLCDPGERWVYGISIDWVGKIVEAVSGQKLGDYMQDNIFKPLEMKSTSFDLSPELRARMARIHSREHDGTLKVVPWEFDQKTEFQQGGGGLYGTMQDYIHFTQMILNNGEYKGNRVLKPETVQIMLQNQIGNIDVEDLITALPNYSNNANFFPGMKQKGGLSFLINPEKTPQGRSAGSIAWAGLSNCYFWVDPVKKITGVFMTQIFPFFDKEAIPIFRDFETAVYESL